MGPDDVPSGSTRPDPTFYPSAGSTRPHDSDGGRPPYFKVWGRGCLSWEKTPLPVLVTLSFQSRKPLGPLERSGGREGVGILSSYGGDPYISNNLSGFICRQSGVE